MSDPLPKTVLRLRVLAEKLQIDGGFLEARIGILAHLLVEPLTEPPLEWAQTCEIGHFAAPLKNACPKAKVPVCDKARPRRTKRCP